jgi:hypothetical protein
MSEPMLSDEVLMAYADGELLEPEAIAVRERARHDPAIAGRIAMFKASRKVLSAVFDPVLDAPVPQRLIDAVQALGRENGAVRSDTPRRQTGSGVVWLRGWRQRAMASLPDVAAWLGGWRQLAVAASVACFVGIVGGWLLGTSGWWQDDSTSLAAQVASLPEPVLDALDRLPSGQRATARFDGLGVAELLPIASYENGGSVCREFEISRPSTEGPQAVRGVVCRSDGRWLLKALADLTTSKAQGDVYRPASGGEDLAPVLGLGRSLSQQEERQFLANGWRHR